MLDLYHTTCHECSRLITQRYSTSFSAGIRAFDPSIRKPIYAIYGFVRFADEIVDTFHDFPKASLLSRFREDTSQAIEERISLNPVLNSFQDAVHQYGIPHELIAAFLQSMEMDLTPQAYNEETYNRYIFGSAEVVGLMCLRVFCEGDSALYDKLEYSAKRLGAAFQKINFLRDIKSDFDGLGRIYFPNVDFTDFNPEKKKQIEADILRDFQDGYRGIVLLPGKARFGVYLAYIYYFSLFKKIRHTPSHAVQEKRIRVNNFEKFVLLFQSSLRMKLHLI